ncbi:helix-turn-helix domain-containing protein [Terrarubrum flagellatum]|uniref:helix-turn-helix domain-containing protein n=1 Tax=Terrirubrum flagellatum TaxID=2895980 RepID=UPI0031453BB6
MSQHVSFAAKETLFVQGEAADAVYSLTSGVARLYKIMPDGRRQIVGFGLPGDFLGLAMRDRYGFSVDAVTEVSACRFARGAYSNFVDDHPTLLRRLHEFATHELTLAQDQMLLLGRRNAEEKLASFLISMRERWAKLGEPSITVELPMSRQDIADFLGLTIETVSRTFTKLAKRKIIAVVPGGVRLVNLAHLETIAAA